MPMYFYIAKDADGKTKKDIVEAVDQQGLVDKLQADGYFVVGVEAMDDGSKKQARKKKPGEGFTHNKIGRAHV